MDVATQAIGGDPGIVPACVVVLPLKCCFIASVMSLAVSAAVRPSCIPNACLYFETLPEPPETIAADTPIVMPGGVYEGFGILKPRTNVKLAAVTAVTTGPKLG